MYVDYIIEIRLAVYIVVLEQFDFTVALNRVRHSSSIGITEVSKPLDTPRDGCTREETW